MDTKSLILQARQAVADSPCNPKKLAAIHTGIAAAAGLIVALLSYLLSTGIGGTGGLSGIGSRAVLETAQSVLSLAVSVLSPFWALGFTAVVLCTARREEAGPRTLLAGFRIWGPALRLMLLEGALMLALAVAAGQLGSFLYTMTPFSQPLNELLLPLIEGGTVDMQAITQHLLEQDPAVLMGLFWGMLPFLAVPVAAVLIPLSYRLRLAPYILLDRPGLGAMFALMFSFRLTKKQSLRLLAIDLRFWWFYALELLVLVLSYGDLLLPLVGATPAGSGVVLSLLFYGLALICQVGLHWWQKPQVMTAYALFYDGLLPKEETQAES